MTEELFGLDGDYVFADRCVMRPGAYCWWREGRYHGPVGSIAGYHMFIRVHGGELVNVFSSEPRKFRWQAPHDPSLPSELASYGTPVEHPDKW
jgi:hypothetical protein